MFLGATRGCGMEGTLRWGQQRWGQTADQWCPARGGLLGRFEPVTRSIGSWAMRRTLNL